MGDRLDVLLVYCHKNYGQGNLKGLGVNATHSVNVLRKLGYTIEAAPIWLHTDLIKLLEGMKELPKRCLIEAPFIPMEHQLTILRQFPSVQFLVRCHSNVGFLQIEAPAVKLLVDLMYASESWPNLTLSGNSRSFCDFMERVYGGRCLYLPNLYTRGRVFTRPSVPFPYFKSVLKAGSFGAIRLQKGHINGAAAALLVARDLGIDLEFYLNTNREEGGGKGVFQAIQNLFTGLSWAKLIPVPWTTWSEFHRIIGEMDICFHLSMTETFSLVSADAMIEGVPVVGSEAIDWLPERWKVNLDDVAEAADVGRGLLFDPKTPTIAREAINKICDANEIIWREFLDK